MDTRTLGVLGGGQLGRMMGEAALRLGVRMAIVDPMGSASPAGAIATGGAVEGKFTDEEKIRCVRRAPDTAGGAALRGPCAHALGTSTGAAPRRSPSRPAPLLAATLPPAASSPRSRTC